MAEASKVYSMDTFADYLKGSPAEGYKKSVLDLLAYLTQKDMDEDFQIFAAALAKAWIYEQHPEMTKMARHELFSYGENVAVAPMPEDVMGVVDAVFERIATYKQTIKEQEAKIAEYEKKLASSEKKINSLQTKVDEYAKREAAGEEQIVASKDKVEEYLTKVDDLLAKIEEVKKHGVVAVGEGEAGADSGETEGPGEDFGFGSTAASSGDDFGF